MSKMAAFRRFCMRLDSRVPSEAYGIGSMLMVVASALGVPFAVLAPGLLALALGLTGHLLHQSRFIDEQGETA